MKTISLALTFLGWTVWGASATSAEPVDLSRIERTIRKEPVYRSKNPKYCLLVFGPEAKTRVWLVLDGDVFYVDRTGSGDLTGEGKRIDAKINRPNWKCKIGTVNDVDGKTQYQNLLDADGFPQWQGFAVAVVEHDEDGGPD